MAAGSTKREFEGSGDTQVVFKKKKDKCRVDNCFAEMGHIHKVVTRNLLQDVAMEMRSFVDQGCSTFIKINRLTLLNSNAIDGSSFSKAFCRISENDDEHSFACLFKKGLHILMTYMERKEMPVNEQESLVLDTLLHYLFEMKNAGNPSVWHGNLDVIVNNQVVVEALEDEPDSDSPGRTPMEVKSTYLSRNPQIIAETIVFSFLQKKRHPEYSHFLFPCIGVNSKDMVVYFYDSKNDVLLESSPISMYTISGGVNLLAIVVSWLVVNHKYLCDGLTEGLKKETSGFFHQAEKVLPIYKNELQFGDVGISCPKPKHQFNFVDDPSRDVLKKDWLRILNVVFKK
ncbi:uncharacterized protein LOC117337465 isoform X2 [Pecten maximus]|uniref:uncharacterized protein LOC117337465 isoform X2 n=1 Tax=Pecten maximus TaxID=6579 RepID=UPI001458B092|nr:uncharacterized protein LOC117337465 isoform X2 [Pecten maximus]